MSKSLLFENPLDLSTRMFPDYWEQWRSNLSGEAGDLVHPVLGPMRARVEGAKGDGFDSSCMSVEFVETTTVSE